MLPFGNFNHTGNRDLRFAHEVIDFVFLEEKFDALGHLAGDSAGTLHHLAEIEVDAFDRKAKLVRLLEAAIEFRALEQGLGGYATPVKARAAGALHFDAGDFLAELSGANRSCIARWAAADYNEIVRCRVRHG